MGYTIITCYHWFDVNFQGLDFSSTIPLKPSVNTPTSNNNIQAMVVVPSIDSTYSSFLNTEVTHHFVHTSTNLSNNALYQGNGKVTIDNGSSYPSPTLVLYSFIHLIKLFSYNIYFKFSNLQQT